jgi:hypothetical protein
MAGKVSRLRGCAWALTVATLPSCGGTAPPTAWSGDSGGAGRDAAAGDVASDAAADDGPSDDSYEAIPPCGNPCPIAEPAVGDSCNFGAACEYGKSPFVPCNRVFSCLSGRAAIVQNFISDASVCTSGLSRGCPASRATVKPGASCGMAAGLQCVYADAECDCIQQNEGPAAWVCSGSSAGGVASCPVPRAMLGTPCSSVNESCQQLSSGVYETCLACGNLWGPARP